MRHISFMLSFFFFVIISCNKTTLDPVIPNSTYTGTFQRQTSTGGQISNVTITFSDSTWTGQSQFARYPGLCHGTYKLMNADSITFKNDCFWTAEFDWTLILGRNYQIKIDDKNIELTRDYNGAYKDVYKLIKQ